MFNKIKNGEFVHLHDDWYYDNNEGEYVYFLRNDSFEKDFVKVGKSKHPNKRIKQLNTGVPVPFECVCLIRNLMSNKSLESLLHECMVSARIPNSEFFYCDCGTLNLLYKLEKAGYIEIIHLNQDWVIELMMRSSTTINILTACVAQLIYELHDYGVDYDGASYSENGVECNTSWDNDDFTPFYLWAMRNILSIEEQGKYEYELQHILSKKEVCYSRDEAIRNLILYGEATIRREE